MTQVLQANEADRSLLRQRTVAVIGFGSQAHAHAQNLNDSGVPVVVGLRERSPSARAARAAGLDVLPIAEAAAGAGLVALLIPDTAQAATYREQIAPHLAAGTALLFAHGFNIRFGQIDPADSLDVIMVAPKSPGPLLRSEYQAGRGVPSLVAVHRDATGDARGLALAYADAIGSTRAGVLETTFAAETETDLFGEQAVLCGGLAELIKAGFETLVEAGYSPDLAYFECLHEVKLIVDLVYAGGLTRMREKISDTAEYGDYVSGRRVVGDASRAAMRQILAEIRSGDFARQWIAEAQAGAPEFHRTRARERRHPIEEVGAGLRARMSWLE